jgi:hypothetical protein
VAVVLVIMLAYEEFESRVLVPRIYGRALRLPSSVVLFALLAGGALMGIFGALLAVWFLGERFRGALAVGSGAALTGLALLTNAFGANSHSGPYDLLAVMAALASGYVELGQYERAREVLSTAVGAFGETAGILRMLGAVSWRAGATSARRQKITASGFVGTWRGPSDASLVMFGRGGGKLNGRGAEGDGPAEAAARREEEAQPEEERREGLGHHRIKRRKSWLTRMSLRWSWT